MADQYYHYGPHLGMVILDDNRANEFRGLIYWFTDYHFDNHLYQNPDALKFQWSNRFRSYFSSSALTHCHQYCLLWFVIMLSRLWKNNIMASKKKLMEFFAVTYFSFSPLVVFWFQGYSKDSHYELQFGKAYIYFLTSNNILRIWEKMIKNILWRVSV